MSNTILTSIEEMVDSSPALDRESTFQQLWQLTGELFERVRARFELKLDASCHDLMPYHGFDGASGYLANYAGPEIDWLVHSWTGNPKATFTNMHLTVALGPQIDVPHFGFALGTTPDFFVYMDYLPRRDLWTRPDYADRNYGQANQAYLSMQAQKSFRPFISRDFYTRVAQSPASLCYGAPVNDENMAIIRKAAYAHLDNWLALIDSATPVPEHERAALAERDLLIRRTITERDPANVVVDKLYGPALGKRLVRQLWGGDRQLPRPGDSGKAPA
jgi:hypothetical protein